MSTYHQELIKEFSNINPKKIKNNIFQDLEIEAYCFNVHDPDTISVLFKYNNTDIIKYNIRLSGIDAPELHSKNVYEKELCIKGTDYLKQLILHKMIKVKTYKTDKYGRMLGDLYTLDLYPNNIFINQDLIDKGYCREYNGDAKKEWNLQTIIPSITLTPLNMKPIKTRLDIVKPKRKYVRKIKN